MQFCIIKNSEKQLDMQVEEQKHLTHLPNQKRITSFKGHKLVKIKEDIENTAWEFSPFQITQRKVALILKEMSSQNLCHYVQDNTCCW